MAKQFIETEEQAGAPAPATPNVAPTFAVKGNRDDDIKRQEAIDPTEVEEVTQEEQDQYDDFVSRAIAMLSDSRKPEGGGESPSDAAIKVMSNSSLSIPQALAAGAVSTIFILHDAAKRAGVEYSPDVLFHGSDEVIACLYLLGSAAGIFDGASDYSRSGAQAGGAAALPQQPGAAAGGAAALPPQQAGAIPQQGQESGAIAAQGGAIPPQSQESGAMAAMPEEGEMPSEGDFTDEEYALMAEAKLLATEGFGRRLVESGQLTKEESQEAQKFWESQITKEIETGQVEDSMFDNIDVPAVRKQIASRTM